MNRYRASDLVVAYYPIAAGRERLCLLRGGAGEGKVKGDWWDRAGHERMMIDHFELDVITVSIGRHHPFNWTQLRFQIDAA